MMPDRENLTASEPLFGPIASQNIGWTGTPLRGYSIE